MSRSEQGFSLVEILIALLVFGVVVVGTITVLGAATAGGFLDAFPTSFATTRLARDYTAASTFLQSFHEFVANQGFVDASPAKDSATSTAGTYCMGPACGPSLPPGWQEPGDPDLPTPDSASYQLNWTRLDVLIEQWYWDDKGTTILTDDEYCLIGSTGCTVTTASGDSIKLVQSTLTWVFKNPEQPRTLTVKRFLCKDPGWCP